MKEPYNILITGGAGYLGSYLVSQLLKNDLINERLIVYSRDELKQFDLKIKVTGDPRVRFVIGDVRDQERLNETMKNVDVVIHAAAMKHVNICEENPSECVKTNIHGTENVIRAARSNGVKQLIFISTDKAVEPCSVYGDSKQVGERLTLNGHSVEMETLVLRLGNLIGSSGSIVDKMRKLGENQVFPVYNPEMTRFADSLENAWMLTRKALGGGFGGCVMVSKLRAINIMDLAQCLADEVKVMGGENRNFEKKHEKLASDQEISRLLVNDQFYILPAEKLNQDQALEQYRSLPAEMMTYDSREVEKLSKGEIMQLAKSTATESANWD